MDLNVMMQTPKMKTLADQCESCPFRAGNDKQFGEIVKKLSKSKRVSKTLIASTRANIELDCRSRIDFACHCTTYTQEMELRPREDRRQCPGATAFYKRHFMEKYNNAR